MASLSSLLVQSSASAFLGLGSLSSIFRSVASLDELTFGDPDLGSSPRKYYANLSKSTARKRFENLSS